MKRKNDVVDCLRDPGSVLSEFDLRVARLLAQLKVLRKTRIGDRGKLSSVIRNGKSIGRLVRLGKRLNAARAMDVVDSVELLVRCWLEDIHRIINEATDV